MRLCALDIESNGLDPKLCEVTELGYVIKDFGAPKPLVLKSIPIQPEEMLDGFITDEITAITGITAEWLAEAGCLFRDAWYQLIDDLVKFNVEYIVAHNGQNFDRPFLLEIASQYGVSDPRFEALPWLDTQHDIVYPKHQPRNLINVAASHGILNPFPHAAVFDAFTTYKVLERYDLHAIIARSKIPWVVVRAMDITPPFRDTKPDGQKDTDLCKARRYQWQSCGDGKTYDKSWVKRVKEDELDKEIAEAPFKVARIDHAP